MSGKGIARHLELGLLSDEFHDRLRGYHVTCGKVLVETRTRSVRCKGWLPCGQITELTKCFRFGKTLRSDKTERAESSILIQLASPLATSVEGIAKRAHEVDLPAEDQRGNVLALLRQASDRQARHLLPP
eukprot:1724179-Rhodomonas_salina.2